MQVPKVTIVFSLFSSAHLQLQTFSLKPLDSLTPAPVELQLEC